MTNARMSKGQEADGALRQSYDLEERTARFGEAVIVFAKSLPATDVTRPLIRQLVRAATSIGANYCEADDAETKADFRHKVALCKKEARETKHWLRMMVAAVPASRDAVTSLWQEAKELNLIFASIRNKTGRR